ncbi:putative glutathione synthetase, ATP-binding domain protein [Bacteriovorax sp. BSW11_IV]|uniref:ATP-grasp domain-containing protein n=1 Tax=Bacteriovorax sp. BSW11_IV TaxID=1353529 RepID=UPI00038A477E|nr:ATP-grasp domain-containing protein [Bacteriovorax sp. BSW11_IV]EQC46415.1 putative glutathione synthetase, ATP-binding domain protein [Bacteriovorax sp. BSW11_IV]
MVKPNIFLVSKNNHLPTLSRFQEEAQALGLSAQIITVEQLSQLDFSEHDFIINRVTGITYDDEDLVRLREIQKRTKTTICNTPNATLSFRDKSKQYNFLLNQGVNTPQTLGLWEFNFNNPQLNPPYIIKPLRGNKGIGVEYFETLAELKNFHMEKLAIEDLRYIVQPYIQKQSELRLFMINGELIGALEKDVQDKVCNASRVECRFIERSNLDEKLIAISIAITKASELFYTGIDVMVFNEQYIFLEMNTSPGFMEFEKYSGINIAKKILKNLTRDD